MKAARDSSLELYRIIVMVAIVFHHYVVNSGLYGRISEGGSASAWFLLGFGAWGKVGINCFVLITGYYMCTKRITLNKFLKLLLQILFYQYLFGLIFFSTGYAQIGVRSLANTLLPFTSLTDNFTGCFLVFFLTIPFLNVVVNNITKRQHEWLLWLTVAFFSLMPTIPTCAVRLNYVEWFVILYFVGSYLRKYPNRLTENRSFWAWLSGVAIVCGLTSVFLTVRFTNSFGPYYFLADVNKITALAAAVCFFLAFKPVQGAPRPFYSPLVNTIASATFGVLLIHANSNAMRRWLWCDVCDCVGWYEVHGASRWLVAAHAVGCVFVIFTVCAVIDLIRQRLVENPLFAFFHLDNT